LLLKLRRLFGGDVLFYTIEDVTMGILDGSFGTVIVSK
tara:strand:- start:2123 stop:2236 length:114 start_codon:yes stop_codon:yes gene_type:complete